MAKTGYRAIPREQVEKLAFHNIMRLMRKVQAAIGFGTTTDLRAYWHDLSCGCNNPKHYIEHVAKTLARHEAYLTMLKDVLRKHPHKQSPKLRRACTGT